LIFHPWSQSMSYRSTRRRFFFSATLLLAASLPTPQAQVPRGPSPIQGPWVDKSLSADARADLLIQAMTQDEKLSLVHGFRAALLPPEQGMTTRSLGGAGFIPGVARLGIPDLQMADSAVGVTKGAVRGRYSTALPSTLAASASWDRALAYDYGALIGKELRDQGYTMSLGGGVNITRESRNGRNFEYQGEDPILAGTMVGNLMKGMQDQHMVGDIKHYAVNDQETGRNIVNAVLDERSLRESDLLAFEIGLHISHASAVMCSYNKVNSDYSCENKYLLTDVLKNTWNFKGFVLSDWGGTHSTEKAAMNGLDMEMPGSANFGESLKQAIADGKVPQSRLDEMVHRILRSEIASGIFDDPPVSTVPNVFAGLEFARKVEEEAIVLLKNDRNTLPLTGPAVKHVLLIGSHADVGVISGGGSAQVDAPGGNVVMPPPNTGVTGVSGSFTARGPVWMPSSPLKALRAQAPGIEFDYDPGTDPAAAEKKAAGADVAIVFLNQPMSEGRDGDLALPDHQDDLVAAIARANKHVVVVLETGGPVTMSWADKVDAIVEAWFPGIQGGDAIAEVLTGAVNPSGKLTVTFPRSVDDLPHQILFGVDAMAAQARAQAALLASPAPPAATGVLGGPGGGARRAPIPPFEANYTEGLLVGYKWYDAKKIAPLFSFGAGLSYTTYLYSAPKVVHPSQIEVSFDVKNSGARAGNEVSQVYVALPAKTNEPPKRLAGWSRTDLKPGESRTVTISIDPHYFAVFNPDHHGWQIVAGEYQVLIGGSSESLPLKLPIHLDAEELEPLLAN
jgi:beta-glucosidase